MKIKHEDVFKYFWKVIQRVGPPGAEWEELIYVKYSAYLKESKKYYHYPGPDENGNGVTLDFFQDKKYYEFPPEGK